MMGPLGTVIAVVTTALEAEHDRGHPHVDELARPFDRLRLGKFGREIDKPRFFPGRHALSWRVFGPTRYMPLPRHHVTIRGSADCGAPRTGTGWSLDREPDAALTFTRDLTALESP